MALKDAKQASESSAEADDQDEADLTEGQVSDGAQSSTAQDETGEKDTLSIVRDVVAARTDDPAASSADGEEIEESSTGEQADPEKAAEQDDDYKDVPFHKHPRFQELLTELKSTRSDAAQYRKVTAFMDNAGLTAEETADGLVIMAAMKTDPVKAWELLKPHVQNILVAAGEVLPEDLAKRVEAGEMTREVALEMSRVTARNKNADAVRSFEEERAARSRQQQAGDALKGAANEWAADRAKKDPNFADKQTALFKELLYLQQTEGKPNTPDGVKAQLAKAYKAITPAAPRAKPGVPTVKEGLQQEVPSSGSTPPSAKPQVKTTMDIVRAEVAKRKR